MHEDLNFTITSIDGLEKLFDAPSEASRVKELDYIDANYRAWIEASPFLAIATAGLDGLDCSPRGDAPGFVEILDDKTLLIPDRRGNNRIDTLRNIICDPRVGLLFLIPGLGETLRINGRATISIDPILLQRFAIRGQKPKVVLRVAVDSVFFQCSRAIIRSDLWNPSKHVERSQLPTPGKILADHARRPFDGEAYDRELPERIKKSLY